MLSGKSIQVTGGTGSFGKALISTVLRDYPQIARLEQIRKMIRLQVDPAFTP